MYFLNKNISDLYRIFDQNERKGYLRLDLNENPVGLPEDFIQEVLLDVNPEFIAQYPETKPFTEVLAKYLGTTPDHICLTNGSSEGIRYIIQAFTSDNGKIVGVVPSYFMFQIYSEMYNRKFVGVNYEDDLTMDINKIIQELTPDTQLLILLNPNNPMGNVYSEDEFNRILKCAKANQITVLIDEAYYYFYPKSFIKYALSEEHVFVTRTFSKMCSMAGCRLGYVVGWPEGVKMVQKLCTPHNTNAFALKFAEAILKKPKLMEKLISDFHTGRNFLLSELKKNNYDYCGEAGNFLFIKPKTNASDLVKKMKDQKKILIKSYDNVGKFGTCLRVSIGNQDVMKKFMGALIELDR